MAITFAAATAADRDEAQALLASASLPTEGALERPEDYVVVRDDGRLVALGGVETHGPDGLLRSVVVAPSHRGLGLASQLVAECLRRADVQLLDGVYLLTTTAREFFLARGFEDCPRDQAPAGIRASWEFRSGCAVTSAFLRRMRRRTVTVDPRWE